MIPLSVNKVVRPAMEVERGVTVVHAFPVWLPQTQTWMFNQVSELQHLGMNAHVVCERTENLDQFSVLGIHCLQKENIWRQLWDKGLRKLRYRRHLDYLVDIARKVKAPIVHSHFGNVAWMNMGAVRKLGAKHVVTFYGLDVNKLPEQNPIWRKRYDELFGEADLILCEGGHMSKCLARLGCPEEKLRVQHLGVNVDVLEFKPRRWRSDQKLKVLIGASFREKKGITYAIEALGLLRQQMPIALTIIGDAGSDAESQREKVRIIEALKRCRMDSVTRLIGYQSHATLIREAYDHHIFVQPSVTASDGDTEGGAPVSIIEMLATGMPVISTTHCDIPEVFGPDLNHLLVSERDVVGLYDCLIRTVENELNWGEWARIGRKRVEEEYHKTKQAARLCSYYHGLAFPGVRC